MRKNSPGSRPGHRHSTRRRPVARLRVEELECRLTPAVSFTQTNLVTDDPAALTALGLAPAARTDPNLVNPWGLTLGTNSGLWIAEGGNGTTESFDSTGQALPAGSPLSVTIPAPGGGTSSPTGVATNATRGFVITSGGNSGPSAELFATEDGTIAGWNDSVDPTNAVIAVDNSGSRAIYKGLAEGFTGAGAFLYATNFHAGTIDVFDQNFQPVQMPGGFTDPDIPAGFAPFGISAINGDLYVTYAKQDADKEDDVAGAGNGFIDIFDTEGHLVERFASQSQLNSPWGMAWVPFQGFGEFDNALFVANFGDGAVNAFDFDSGEFLGRATDASGTPITVPGIWALQFGLGLPNASETLFFTAGINDEQDGLFGTLTVNPDSLPEPEGPTLTDPGLRVTTAVSGLNQPIGLTFLGPNDFLVLEKASGKIQHVVNGTPAAPLRFVTPGGTTLDNLPVNSASERGLLGSALDPDFATNHLVYLYWTESSTGTPSGDLAEVGNPNSPFPPGTNPPLGNRVDRFVYDPQANTLTYDRNLIQLRAFQQDDTHPIDADQPARGNHDAGKILFGPDGKLYLQIGDNGRRGQPQNLPQGPFGPGLADDQFGGPVPDDAHATGIIFRLNPDGTIPADNPFAGVTAQQFMQIEQQAGVTLTQAELDQAVANVHKIFSYGRRNGFGLAFDPMTGSLWESENADDSFDEINRVTAGSNGGWVQIMGPADHLSEFKEIEASFTPLQGNLPLAGNLPFSAVDPATFLPALQQLRWPPSLIADTTADAMSRLFVLPGSHYEDPEFSWEWAVAPAGIGFAGDGLGPQHAGHLFVGGARTFLDNGYLMEFKLDPTRQHFAFDDPELADRVADNEYKFDEDGSESLIVGENFGIVTDIQTGPDGNLYLTSLTDGKVYTISAAAGPTISDIADVTVPPGQGSVTRSFTLGDAQTPAEQLTVTASSSNPTLLPDSGVVLGGSGTNRTVTVTPAAGQSGIATVTVTVTDPGGQTATDTFVVTVPVRPRLLAVGGSDGSVRLIDAATGAVLVPDFRPLDVIDPIYGNNVPYTGLVEVALGDVTGDGVDDLFAAAASPAGEHSLDAGKAGKVFVYDGTALTSGKPPTTPIRGFTPFRFSDGQEVATDRIPATTPYANGLNIAAADVDGDGRVDLIAGTRSGSATAGRREYGRLVVVSGDDAAPIGDIVKPFGNGYEKGVVVAGGDADGDGKAEVAVTRGGPVAPTNPNRTVKFKAYRLTAGSLSELNLSGTGMAFAPFASVTGPNGEVIERDARVAFVDPDGDGKAALMFTALDRVTDPNDVRVRVAAFAVDTTTGLASLVSTGTGTTPTSYLIDRAAADHAIAGVDADGDGRSDLAVVVEDSPSAVLYLDPLTGSLQPGGFDLPVLTGGVSLNAD